MDFDIEIDNVPVDFDPAVLAALLPANVSLVTWSIPDAYVAITSVQCPAGYFCAGGTLKQPCYAGTYSTTVGATSDAVCTACSVGFPGMYCAAGSTAGSACPDGSYYLNMTTCRPCPNGHFCANAQSLQPQTCPSGYYLPLSNSPAASSAACVACPAGSYCTLESTIPVACPAGTFRTSLYAASMSECTSCLAGAWCATGATAVTLCTGNTWSSATGATNSSTCQACSFGKICIDGATTSGATAAQCPAGSYCPSDAYGAVSMIKCPQGTYNSLTGQVAQTACRSCSALLFCPAGSTRDGTFCPAGQYILSGACVDCTVGHYCNASVTYACSKGTSQPLTAQATVAACVACPAGTYSDAAASTSCTNCPAGTYSAIASQTVIESCLACPKGGYCAAGVSGMTPCPAGYFQDQNSMTSINNCQNCSVAGQICGVGTVTPITAASCAAGYYCPANSNAPMPCPVGTFSATVGARTLPTECTNCAANAYCPAGSTAQGTCSAGSYLVDGNLQLCSPAGYSCDGASCGSAACSIGQYTGVSGSSACNTCTAGNYCPAASTAVTPCQPGSYKNTAGGATGTRGGDCSACPAGSYCPNSATVTPIVCDAGSYCPLNSFQTSACLAGTYRSTTGGIAASDCTICPPGSYCVAGSVAAQPAPAGVYIDKEGAPTPVPGNGFAFSCDPELYVCATGSSAPTPIAQCPVGYYCTTGVATPNKCPIFTYKNVTGKHYGNVSDCLPCPNNYVCPSAGTVQPSLCDSGKYVTYPSAGQGSCTPCTKGNYCLPTSPQPIPCAAGTYNPNYLGDSTFACLVCPAGAYCLLGASTPTPCASGYYNNATGKANQAAACTTCPAGSYCLASSTVGVSVPAPCPMGNYRSTVGAAQSSDCSSCPAGSFCPDGSVLPKACAAGSYSSIQGGQSQALSCTPCDINSYCPSAGMTFSLPCLAHTYTESTGASSKLACRCLVGYSCTYTEHLTATITIVGNATDFLNNVNNQKQNFINAVAQSAGVPSSSVFIITITPHTAQVGGGLRRHILGVPEQQKFNVLISVRGAQRMHDFDGQLRSHLGNTFHIASLVGPGAMLKPAAA